MLHPERGRWISLIATGAISGCGWDIQLDYQSTTTVAIWTGRDDNAVAHPAVALGALQRRLVLGYADPALVSRYAVSCAIGPHVQPPVILGHDGGVIALDGVVNGPFDIEILVDFVDPLAWPARRFQFTVPDADPGTIFLFQPTRVDHSTIIHFPGKPWDSDHLTPCRLAGDDLPPEGIDPVGGSGDVEVGDAGGHGALLWDS